MMLHGAVFAEQTPRMIAFETNERRVAKISEMMDPCFLGRNVAVMQCKQFVYADGTAMRWISNAAAPKQRSA